MIYFIVVCCNIQVLWGFWTIVIFVIEKKMLGDTMKINRLMLCHKYLFLLFLFFGMHISNTQIKNMISNMPTGATRQGTLWTKCFFQKIKHLFTISFLRYFRNLFYLKLGFSNIDLKLYCLKFDVINFYS